MHAIVLRVTLNDVDAATEALNSEVIPQVKQAPGFVAGYWTRKDNTGLSMTIWESEDNARAAADRMQGGIPESVTLDDYEIREVVASA